MEFLIGSLIISNYYSANIYIYISLYYNIFKKLKFDKLWDNKNFFFYSSKFVYKCFHIFL